MDLSLGDATAARRITAERMAPLLALEALLERSWSPRLDLDRARARVAARRSALEAMEIVGSAGDIHAPFVRATKVMERAGLASNEESANARALGEDVLPLIADWLSGAATPRDAGRALARRAAVLVARGRLRAAVVRLRGALSFEGWTGRRCPCCDGHPEFATPTPLGRMLMCARCDATWAAADPGCSGCGTGAAPAVVRVAMPDDTGYRLVVCHACGLYLKEGTASIVGPPLVERALTAHLDAAAEARGLRL